MTTAKRAMTALALAAMAVLAGCDRDAAVGPQPATVTEATTTIRDAPAEADVGGVAVRLEAAQAWRDVQPYAGGGVPRCAYLCAAVEVVPVDGGDLAGVEVGAVWALIDEGAAEFQRLRVRESEGQLHVEAHRGPRADPGMTVTIVVQLDEGIGETIVRSSEVVVEEAN